MPDLAADLNEVLALADKATPGELIARVIERNEEVRDAFLIVPSIEQGRSIAGPIPMEWLADDSYHEGGPEQKAHDARFTAAAVNFLRTHRAALLGMAGDSRRLDWIADNGQAVRGVNVGRRNILAWAERAPDPQGNCRTNLRAQIDAALQAEQASQQAREGGMEHDFTTARRGAIIKPLQAGSRELLLELLLQRPNKVWNAAHEDHTILARGIVVDPIELRALAETPALPNPKEDQP